VGPPLAVASGLADGAVTDPSQATQMMGELLLAQEPHMPHIRKAGERPARCAPSA
jgi:hypothetical protein